MLAADEALQRVLEGGFSLIDLKDYISVIVAARYTDSFGNTPFYISKWGLSVLATYGWGVRQVCSLLWYWRSLYILNLLLEQRNMFAFNEEVFLVDIFFFFPKE